MSRSGILAAPGDHLGWPDQRQRRFVERLQLGRPQPDMPELIDQCEAMGLVERQPDPSDKRARMVRFTPGGEKWLADFGRSVAQAQREMDDEAGAQEMKTLCAALAGYGGTGAHD